MSEGWFCKIGEKKIGPLSVQQLKTIAARGQLRAEHLVRRGDAGPWVPAGRVKGLFPEKPSAGEGQPAAAKPAQAKTVARAAPAPPASELPPELSLGSGGGHKHHVAMNVDQLDLDIDAEPVMVSTRKTKGVPGLKKDEQQKLTMLLLVIIGGGLLVALVLFLWAASQGYFSSPHKEEAKKEESKSEEQEQAKKAAKTEEKSAEKDDDQWTKFPQSVRRKNVEVRPENPVRGDPPDGSQVDASEHPTVLVLPFKLVLKLGVKEEVGFAGWDESERKNISLKDDTKAAYKLLDVIVESKGPATIGPGKPVTAKLIFEPPLSKAKFLRLEMPGSAIGEQGMLKFQVPCAKITASREAGQKKAPAEEAEEPKAKTKPKKKATVKPADAEEEEPAEAPPPKKKPTKKKSPAAEATPDDEASPPPAKKKATPKKPLPADDTAKIDLPPWAKQPKPQPKQGLDMGDDK
jgi:hypothetical protein